MKEVYHSWWTHYCSTSSQIRYAIQNYTRKRRPLKILWQIRLLTGFSFMAILHHYKPYEHSGMAWQNARVVGKLNVGAAAASGWLGWHGYDGSFEAWCWPVTPRLNNHSGCLCLLHLLFSTPSIFHKYDSSQRVLIEKQTKDKSRTILYGKFITIAR